MNHKLSQNSFEFSSTPSKVNHYEAETCDFERISDTSAEPLSFFPRFQHSKTPKYQFIDSTVDKGSPPKLRRGKKDL